jgi:hypothetical protein
MKSIKTISAILLLLSASCTERLEEINLDPNRLEASQSNPGPLFAKSVNMSLHKDNFSQNLELIADFGPYAHYFTTLYPTAFAADPYFDATEWSSFGFWTVYWTANGLLIDVIDLTDSGAKFENPNNNAMARIWRVYLLQRLTDAFGDIPFHESGASRRGIINPKYDTQQDVYEGLFQELDKALTGLSEEIPGRFKTQDIIYSGDIEKWKKFANTLKLRMALRLQYVDPATSRTRAEEALSGGLISSNDDNAIEISGDANGKFYHPIFQISSNLFAYSPSFKISASLVEFMKGNHIFRDGDSLSGPDPRMNILIADNINGEKMGIPNGHTAEYLNQHPEFAEIGSWALYHNNLYEPVMIMSYAESRFLEAEAALLGYSGTNGTAAELYQKGIEASIEFLGANPGTYPADEAASFSALTNDENRLERIIYQKWVALFPDAHEAWSEQRRTGYPVIQKRTGPDFEQGITNGTIPNRIPYPTGELNTNFTNVGEARQRQGGDGLLVKIWWDTKTLQDGWE